MNTEVAIDIFKNTIVFALYMVAPFLGAALIIGLITSLIQSVTSIQEATLSFAPKLLVMSVVAIALAPWILKSMTDFTIEMFAKMVELGH